MDVKSTVANNFKSIREQRKLSLDTVSGMTGVSKSMLGQIERGEVNPTISVLWKIANGLKISFSVLVEKPAKEMQVIKAESIRPMVEGEGAFINYPVFTFDENTRFETYRIEILQGGSFESLAHLAGAEEYITVFEGSMDLDVNGSVCRLNRGDSLRFKADVPHRYRNVGEGGVQLFMIIYYAK